MCGKQEEGFPASLPAGGRGVKELKGPEENGTKTQYIKPSATFGAHYK